MPYRKLEINSKRPISLTIMEEITKTQAINFILGYVNYQTKTSGSHRIWNSGQ